MLKHLLVFLIAFSVCLILTNSVATAAEPKDLSPTGSSSAPSEPKPSLFIPHQLKLKYPDYMLDVQRLNAFSTPAENLRGNYTFDRFEQEAEVLLQKWLDKERLLYYDLTLEVCNILDSTSWRNRGNHPNALISIREDKMEIEYARRALAKSREPDALEIPLDAELSLLKRIMGEPEYFEGKLSGAAWASHRREKMALFARGFQRLAAEIDENHDFSKELSINPPFPAGLLNFESGMAPSAIKDPKLRAEYERLIVAHRRELAERGRQNVLRKFRRSFSNSIGKYIVPAYLIPPHNTIEMENFLEKYIKDEEIKRTLRTKYAEGLIKYNEGLRKQGK